jgi:beta-galactosidase
LEITLRNPGDKPVAVTVENQMVPWRGGGDSSGNVEKTFAPLAVQLAAGDTTTLTVREKWENPKIWWPSEPNLYWAVTTVKADGKPVDVKRTRFGFREWTWDTPLFCLNGVKWQMWSDAEKADPRGLVEEAKRSGENMMRLWSNGGLKGMTRREVLDYFDETGMCVRSSGILDGEVGSYGPGLVETGPDGKRRAKEIFFANWRSQLAAWVKEERNHPSVFIWSVENEIVFINLSLGGMLKEGEPAVRDAALSVMKIDPTRPVMVDGGNALSDASLPVNGAHYIEFSNCNYRDFPDAAYSLDHFYGPQDRGLGRAMPDRPLFLGESFYANGTKLDDYATFGGEKCFIGMGETGPTRSLIARMLSEGNRWCGVAAWWHLVGGGPHDYWQAWQPVAVLCRQWNWTFGCGQKVDRLLKVFNSTQYGDPITASWEFQVDGKKVAGDSQAFAIAPGETQEWPVSFACPTVAARTAGRFVVTASRGGKEVYHDEKPLSVLATGALPKPKLSGGELAVYDPKGPVAAFLKARKIDFTAMKSLDDVPATAKVIVLGPDCIPPERTADSRWYSLALQGTKVVVLDQENPLRYQALPADAEPTDWTGRIAFVENLSHPVFAGLTQADLFTWGNDHIVYRNAYRKGTVGGRSLVQCDEGLKATAFLECQPGDGLLLVSQLAIGGKLATEGVAQVVFSQMLDYAANYQPVRKPVRAAAPADGLLAKQLQAIAVQYQVVDNPLAAIQGEGIAVVEATPANLQVLADHLNDVETFCSRGNWLMLCGLTPDGLADYNRLVKWNHVIRPFDTERVVMATPQDPLTAGMALRDVVLDTGKQISTSRAGNYPDPDEFSYIVDHTDIAPFCVFPTMQEMGKAPDAGLDHHPRNMVNGFTSDDGWIFAYTTIPGQGHKTKWTLTLPKEEEIVALRIRPSAQYDPLTRMDLLFDDDPTSVAFELRPEPVEQELEIPAHRTKTVTMKIAKWDPRSGRNIVVIDNIWLKVKRPPEYLARVKSMLNIGGLMRYDIGKGGIVLNQLKLVENEKNPENEGKKRSIAKGLLANMGAVFAAGGRTLVAGESLRYEPVRIPTQNFNAWATHNNEPGWFAGPGDVSSLPVGERTFANVRWLLNDFRTSPAPTVIMLKSPYAKAVKDDRVTGIPVGRTADALFFLHTFDKAKPIDDFEKNLAEQTRRGNKTLPAPPAVFQYIVNYTDGTSQTLPVVWGRDIGHWAVQKPAACPNAAIAWIGPLAEAKDGEQAVVYAMQWNNPEPGKEIASVDLVSVEKGKWGTPAVFAITTATAAH